MGIGCMSCKLLGFILGVDLALFHGGGKAMAW
jgi:hypothetical protein